MNKNLFITLAFWGLTANSGRCQIIDTLIDVGGYLISWGSSLLKQGKKEEAIEVFKLNVALNPAGADTYEKLTEAYEAAGNKEFAIKNFKQSLQIDPDNTNAKDHLKKLLP